MGMSEIRYSWMASYSIRQLIDAETSQLLGSKQENVEVKDSKFLSQYGKNSPLLLSGIFHIFYRLNKIKI